MPCTALGETAAEKEEKEAGERCPCAMLSILSRSHRVWMVAAAAAIKRQPISFFSPRMFLGDMARTLATSKSPQKSASAKSAAAAAKKQETTISVVKKPAKAKKNMKAAVTEDEEMPDEEGDEEVPLPAVKTPEKVKKSPKKKAVPKDEENDDEEPSSPKTEKKRTPSGYQLFLKEKFAEAASSNPDEKIQAREMFAEAGKEWKALDARQKAKYTAEAAELKGDSKQQSRPPVFKDSAQMKSPSGYKIFCAEMRKEALPDRLSLTQLSEMWKEVAEAEKQAYNNQAATLKKTKELTTSTTKSKPKKTQMVNAAPGGKVGKEDTANRAAAAADATPGNRSAPRTSIGQLAPSVVPAKPAASAASRGRAAALFEILKEETGNQAELDAPSEDMNREIMIQRALLAEAVSSVIGPDASHESGEPATVMNEVGPERSMKDEDAMRPVAPPGGASVLGLDEATSLDTFSSSPTVVESRISETSIASKSIVETTITSGSIESITEAGIGSTEGPSEKKTQHADDRDSGANVGTREQRDRNASEGEQEKEQRQVDAEDEKGKETSDNITRWPKFKLG